MVKNNGIFILSEVVDEKIHPITYELLGKGREIANKLNTYLSSIILGYNIKELAKELIYYGSDKVYVYDHPLLRNFDVLLYKHNIVKLLLEEKPSIFLIGATPFGRSLGPRIAAALNTGLTADCIDLDIDEEGNLIQIRPAFSGNIIAYIKTSTKPQMCTIRYKTMKPAIKNEKRIGEIINKNVEILNDNRIEILDIKKAREINISDAEVIVSAGRGLKKPEDFSMIKELADLLGGVVGSSRPLVDEGWISKEHQVGFSGNTVKPKVYIACGISGSPQHLFGMRDSEIIIAINIDPSAPIFRVAHYGIIGDMYKIIPKLIEEIKRRLKLKNEKYN
ncbi:MAG: electron transfer flavoprotein subunit alpha/FixB family protein [Nitrososphaerota archaeon]